MRPGAQGEGKGNQNTALGWGCWGLLLCRRGRDPGPVPPGRRAHCAGHCVIPLWGMSCAEGQLLFIRPHTPRVLYTGSWQVLQRRVDPQGELGRGWSRGQCGSLHSIGDSDRGPLSTAPSYSPGELRATS